MLKKNNFKTPDLEKIKYWVFDLDNTLYSHHADLFTQVDHKMGLFIQEMFGISYADAKIKQKQFFRKHGTTLRGLMTEHAIEPFDYLEFVHNKDFSVLRVDEMLNDALDALPGKKFIYTNASNAYAEIVLSHIGLVGRFDDIFDIHDADFLPKPDIRSYHKMIEKFAINPETSIMVEDIAGNLNPAAELGMETVWVPTDTDLSQSGQIDKNIDYIASDLSGWLKNVADSID